MLPLVAVLRVVNVLPQVQVTWVSTYAGWMSFFMVSSRCRPPGRRALPSGRARGEPEPRGYLASQRGEGANPSRSVAVAAAGRRLLDLHQELDVARGLLQPLQQQ